MPPTPRRPVPPAVPTLAPVDKKAKVAERIRRVIFALRTNLRTQDQVTLDRCLTLLTGQEAYIALGIGPGGAVAQNNKLACAMGLIVFAARRLRDYARSEIEPKDLEPALLTLEDLAASGWAKYDAVADGPVWHKLVRKDLLPS